MSCIGCGNRHAATSFVHNEILLSWLHLPPPITLGDIASDYQFVLHTLKSLVHDCPPEGINTRTYSRWWIHPTSLRGLPLIDTPHDVANLYHIAVHNTLSLLLLRNAPPDEVSNAILVVLCLYGLTTSIGFCVNWILHNNKLNYQSHSAHHWLSGNSLYRCM